MMWLDYTINQAGEHFTVVGDYPGEVMGFNRDGSPKDRYLYKPGDVFIVDKNGWLRKTDPLVAMVLNNKPGSDSR